MPVAQARAGCAAIPPSPPRLVRVYRGGVHQLAGGVHHGHLHAGADARVQPHHHPRAGGRCQQQVAQVVRKDLDRHLLGVVAQAGEQVAFGGQAELDAPGPGDALAHQVVGGAARWLQPRCSAILPSASEGRRGPCGRRAGARRRRRAGPVWRPGCRARARETRPAPGARAPGRSARRSRSSPGTWPRRAGSRPCRPSAVDLSRPFGPQPFAQLSAPARRLRPSARSGCRARRRARTGSGWKSRPLARCRPGARRLRPRRPGSANTGWQTALGQRLEPASRAIWPLVRRLACRAGRGLRVPAWWGSLDGGAQRGGELALFVDGFQDGGAGPAVRAGRPGGTPARAAGCRPARRWLPCGSGR
jgi:hypothetical protein